MGEPKEKKYFLIVRQISDRKEVHRVDVSGKSERSRERVQMGMLRNMSDEFFIDELEE